MSYKQTFLNLERSYRPRNDFNHQQVVRELSKVCAKADSDRTEMTKRLRAFTYLLVASVFMNIIFLYGTVHG